MADTREAPPQLAVLREELPRILGVTHEELTGDIRGVTVTYLPPSRAGTPARVGRARRGIYMSDGTINLALLKIEGNEKPGVFHFGAWVDDLAETEKLAAENGGSYLAGRPTSPHSFYECKYRDPDGIVFDVTHNGWAGAVKDVVPAKTPEKAGA